MITSDVCDKCWGSGDKFRPGANLRKIRGQLNEQEKNPSSNG